MATQFIDTSRLYGITHQIDGSPIVREAKLVKVGIGMPKGKSAMVWTESRDGKLAWCVSAGYEKGKTTVTRFASRGEAERHYDATAPKSPECPYPRKISWFTFTRPTADGSFEPDFDAIEAHGPMPSEIDIVFMADDPFAGEYQMWSASELKCHGNGIDAMRVLGLAATDEEKALAAEMKAAGQKMFPIIDGCWTRGCPYQKPEVRNGKECPSPCKPSGDLRFQLVRNLRVGGTCYFHTTGYRSISQIFSSLYRIKTLTGGLLVGIPLVMVLRPYKTNHNGQAATQYGVSLEFRADTIEALRKNMIEQALSFRRAIAAPPAMLPAGSEDMIEDGDEEQPEAVRAAAMAAEFYPEVEDRPAAAAASAPAAKVAAKTEERTAGLRDRMRGARATTPGPEPVPGPEPPPPVQVAVPNDPSEWI